MALTEPQIQRYARHVLLPDVGGVGQARLLGAAARVELDDDLSAAVAAAIYLAAAGVGAIALGGDTDRAVTAQDVLGGVALGEADLGQPLGAALIARLTALNPDVRVTTAAIVGAHPLPDVGVTLAPVPGAIVADALIRGGAAAARLIHQLATTP